MQRAHARGRDKYELPKRIHVTDSLPRNAMGKVRKKNLRERHEDTFATKATPQGPHAASTTLLKAGPGREVRLYDRNHVGEGSWWEATPTSPRCRAIIACRR